MYKEDLALNNLKWLLCHKTNMPNQTSPSYLKNNKANDSEEKDFEFKFKMNGTYNVFYDKLLLYRGKEEIHSEIKI